MLSKIIGTLLFGVGIVLTILSEKKKAGVYHYGTVLAKVVEKRSMRDLYTAGELEKLGGPKAMLKLSAKSFENPPEDPHFKVENKLYPIYEYDFQGSPRRMQSYCESYCPENEFETIYLDSKGNVNDAYVRAGQLPFGIAFLSYGLAVLIMSLLTDLLPKLLNKSAISPNLFIYFGGVGMAVLLSAVYSYIQSFKYRAIEAPVMYNYLEASESTDSDDFRRIRYSYYPIMKYEHEGKTLWRRSNLGGAEYKKDSISIHVDHDGEPHENRSNLFLLVFGIFWVGILTFVLFN